MQNRNMTAKEYLEQIYVQRKKIERTKAEIAFWNSRKTDFSSADFEPHYNATAPTEATYAACIAKIDELEQKLKSQEARLAALKKEIGAVIQALPAWQERAVLEYRYIDCLDWETIQGLLYISRSTVFRIHNNAIVDFTKRFKSDFLQ